MKKIKVKSGYFQGAGVMMILIFERCSTCGKQLHYPISRPSVCPHCNKKLVGIKLLYKNFEERVKYHLEPKDDRYS